MISKIRKTKKEQENGVYFTEKETIKLIKVLGIERVIGLFTNSDINVKENCLDNILKIRGDK